MATDNKKAKADPAPKSEAAAKDKSAAGEAVHSPDVGSFQFSHKAPMPNAVSAAQQS